MDERTPLISNENAAGAGEPPTYDQVMTTSGGESIGDGTTLVPAQFEQQQTVQSPATGGPTVLCRVCQASIGIEGKMMQHVVKCAQCNEATVSRILAALLNNACSRSARRRLARSTCAARVTACSSARPVRIASRVRARTASA